jgi:hypothetical protein
LRAVEQATADRGVERPARVAAIGAAITAFAFLDAYTVGVLIAVLAAWLSALIMFAVAAVALTPINGACRRWVERQWDAWIAGNTKRIEVTLAKQRKSRLMRHLPLAPSPTRPQTAPPGIRHAFKVDPAIALAGPSIGWRPSALRSARDVFRLTVPQRRRPRRRTWRPAMSDVVAVVDRLADGFSRIEILVAFTPDVKPEFRSERDRT